MNTYYVAGIPCSDELWHYGTKGMKWGRRLYQYEDGSLTPLGKIHYSSGKAVKAVGKAAKAVAKHEVESFKRRHPWTMTDDEIRKAKARIDLERNYLQAKADLKKMKTGKIRKFIGGVLQKTGDKLVNRATDELVNKIFKKKDETTDWEDVLKNPKNYTDKQVGDASARAAKLNSLRKADAEINKKSDSYGTAKDVSSVIKKTRVYGPNTWESKKTAKEWSSKVDWGSVSASKASTSAKGVKAEKWTKKSGVLESDYVYNSYADYRKAKDGKIKGW